MPTDFKPTHIYNGGNPDYKGLPCELLRPQSGFLSNTEVRFEDDYRLYPEDGKLEPITTLHPPHRETERNFKPNHYHSGGIDPWQFIEANLNPQQAIGFHLGNVLKYVARHEKKNGLEDLKKAQDDLKEAIRIYEKQQPETDS